MPISPHHYSAQHRSILKSLSPPFSNPFRQFSLHLSCPHFLFLALPPSLFFSKWCHQSLLRLLPKLITQSAAGCSWMHLYGLTVRARGQAGGYICHDTNALTQRSVLTTVAWTDSWEVWTYMQTCTPPQEIKSADRQPCACISKRTKKVCLDRCPGIPKWWRV